MFFVVGLKKKCYVNDNLVVLLVFLSIDCGGTIDLVRKSCFVFFNIKSHTEIHQNQNNNNKKKHSEKKRMNFFVAFTRLTVDIDGLLLDTGCFFVFIS